MTQPLRDQIADELCAGATPEQSARVRKIARTVGNIADQLLLVGLGAQDVLQACCAVTGLPPAPLAWLRQPKLATAPTLDLELCRRLGAVPLQGPANRLCVVFGDPELGAESTTLGLPPHHAYLALGGDLARAMDLLPAMSADDIPRTTVGGPGARTDPEPRTATAQVAAHSSDPLDDVPPDGATIMTSTITSHEESSDVPSDDDVPLFDDPTSAVPAFALPSAPKPVARRHDGAVTEVASSKSEAGALDDRGAARMATAQRVKRAPSLATPAEGSQLDDLAAKPTIVTAQPPPPPLPAPARPSPTGKRAASPPASRPSPSGAMPVAPRTTVDPSATVSTIATEGAPAKPRPPAAQPKVAAAERPVPPQKPLTPQKPVAPHKPLTPQKPLTPARPPTDPRATSAKPLVVDDAAPTEFTPPPPSRRPGPATTPEHHLPPDTQQRALAVLSADDLLDDDPSAGLAADGPPLELDYERAPPRKRPGSEPDAPHTVYAEGQSGNGGGDGNQGDRASEPSDGGSFAAAADADDQQSVAHQKQRMKRIAQIASIKRYKMDRVLGRGGMATVYLATDTRTGRPCALKLMEPHLAEDDVFVERFKREIKASISLSHENIVGVFDFGEENGTYYMASEYVDAGTVAALLKTLDRPLPPALAVPIMMGFLDGLGAAHAQGFVHRDLKPANLMLTSGGVVKIGDFGIAKAQTDSTLTKTGALFGTPAYMSPEQATGQELDGRSDLFAAGIIFYELLAGYNPYAHENPSTTMFAIARGQARPIFDANPTVPGAAERVVMRLLEKDKNKRYQTAAEARDDLMALGDLLQKQFPGAVAGATKDPVAKAQELSKAQAALEVERARKQMQRVPPESAEACFRYYKATLLDPNSFDAMNGLTQLRAEYGFRFTRPDDKQILELEAALEKKPDQPAVLRRLADLSASHRNLVDMAGFAKRYLRYQPGDTHMQGRLERVIGSDPLAPFSRMAVDNAAQLAQQSVAASDDMRDAARAAIEEQALAARAAPVRPSLRPGTQPTPSREAPAGDSNPGSLELDDVGPRKSRHAVGGAALAATVEPATPATAQPEVQPMAEEPELPAPRDSLEAGVRLLRQAWRDTVRSLTGDRGVAAVKQELRARLQDGRREAKEAAKVALQASKNAVKQNVLDEKGRQALKAEMKKQGVIGLRRHWRLALVVLLLWGLLIGAGKACHMLCFDSSKDGAVAAPAAGRASGAKPATPLATDAAQEKPDDSRKPGDADRRPVDDERRAAAAGAPDAETSAPTAPAPMDAAAPAPHAPSPASGLDLGKRQNELRVRATKESDSARAIDLYTQAIDVDPYSKGARDALLERARLLLAEGDLEHAERDIFALKRRPDVDAVRADLDQMLTDLESAKKAAEAAPPPAP